MAMLVDLVRSIVVATAVATTTTNVLLIAAMVVTLSLAMAAIARGMRQSKGRQSRGVVGVERL
jgi:hypothetical protein